jgi:hypothetical protein
MGDSKKPEKPKIQAWVINLDRRTDRWEHMQKEFAPFIQSGVMELNRFSALFPSDADKAAGAGPINFCCLSQVTCAWEAWQSIGAPENEGVLILQDDAILCNPAEFIDRWTRIKAWLDGSDTWDAFNGGPLFISDPKPVGPPGLNIYELPLGGGIANHFMYYSPRIIRELYKMVTTTPISKLPCLDRYTGMRYKQFTCYPFLSVQKDGYSDLRNGRPCNSHWFIVSEAVLRKTHETREKK